MTDIEHCEACGQPVPGWSGRRNDYIGLSTMWAKRAHATEGELSAAVELREGAERAARAYRADAEALRADAEALAHAVSAALAPNPHPFAANTLVAALEEYLAKHPWSDL